MNVSQSTYAIRNGMNAWFLGTGGTDPYTYAVAPGGVGGTINSSTGEYTAPSTGQGEDTIVVTDSLAATAEATIDVCLPIQLLCDIIQREMELQQGQVYLWDQKINIPIDDQLYIAVAVISCKPFANTTKFDSSGDAIQSVNMSALVSIDILSRGPDARDRKEEVLLALKSIYSQSQQEINSFYIGTISTDFVNLSEVDGAAIPYRFNISVRMQYFFRKSKAVPYFEEIDDVEVTSEP